MNRIIAWLTGTMILMILMTGYQVRVAGAGGDQEHGPEVSTVQNPGPSGAPAAEESHPPK